MSLLYENTILRKDVKKMEMKVHLPMLALRMANGELCHYFASRVLPIFYRIPKVVLEIRGKELLKIPRTVISAFVDNEIISFVNSDVFMNGLINCVAYMVWPHLGVSPKMEVYSNYDPAWQFAYTLPIWVRGFMDYGGMLDSKSLYDFSMDFPPFTLPYLSMEEATKQFAEIVPQVMQQYKIDEILDIAKSHRCFEDFDERWESNQKIDFFRQWYHTRTKYEYISLDEYIAEGLQYNSNFQWEPADTGLLTEDSITSKLVVEQFTETLSEKDMQILKLRLEGYTQKEIAEMLGYKTHSAVTKRIKAIGEAYEKFTGEDLGFEDEK